MDNLKKILDTVFNDFIDVRKDVNKMVSKIPEKERDTFTGILSKLDEGIKNNDVDLLTKELKRLQNIQKHRKND